jgi:hypothetical protein
MLAPNGSSRGTLLMVWTNSVTDGMPTSSRVRSGTWIPVAGGLRQERRAGYSFQVA